MEIKKAIVTAASKSQRTLPLQSIVDRDGAPKTALRIIIEEILQAGIEEICLIVSPGDQAAYANAAGPHAARLHFVEQKEARGYGHAVQCGADFAGGSAFLLLVGDHLYVSTDARHPCAQQLVEAARAEHCAVSAVQATHESKLPYYGAIGGRLVSGRAGLYEISDVLEKPTPTEAEQKLVVPGLRNGFYLCFFGMHVLTPTVMELLRAHVAAAEGRGTTALTPALASLIKRERYLACELKGKRYDIGLKYGVWTAQLALALNGRDRDEVLGGMVETLAVSSR